MNYVELRGQYRPKGMSLFEAFDWAMPGPPPDIGCWDWTGRLDKDGYGRLDVRIDGKTKNFRAHRVSYLMYCGTIPGGLSVLHSCDRRVCVSPNHLRTGTHGDNTADAAARDRFRHGEGHPLARLTVADVRWIRAHPELTAPKVAEIYGISRGQAQRIRNRERWRHVS